MSRLGYSDDCDDSQSDAEVYRKYGWRVGTRLVGDEGCGPTVIKLTAIGERNILAKTISHDGKKEWARPETSWTLSCRGWKIVR